MIGGPFQELLEDLGRNLHLKLHVDEIGACSILFPPALIVQLQLDSAQENLFLFCKIAEIPPGKFRENVLTEALKANGKPDPISAILGYYHTANQLACYQNYPIHILNGERLAMIVTNFISVAVSWQKSLSQGNPKP